MITGLFTFAAVSMTAFMVLLPVQLAAGKANERCLARANTSVRASPVRTPGGNCEVMVTCPSVFGLALGRLREGS